MMTQTHILVAAAGFARPGKPVRNTAALLGGFLPDAALYGLFAWARMDGISAREIFQERYWSPAWQAAMSPGNSIFVWLAVLAAGWWLSRQEKPAAAGLVLIALSGAALAHIALDFPLHHDDGHTHLWPLTNWKFASPVSYWDTDHYAMFVRPVEFALGIACLVVLFRRFSARWVRALCVVGIAVSIIEPLVFLLMMR